MEIAVLAFEGCLGSGVLGPLDMLTLGRRMISKKKHGELYGVSAVSFDGKPVLDGNGRRIEVDASFESIGDCAAIIVPGYVCDGGHSFPATPAIGAAAAWIRRQHALGALILASCNGVFLLGEAGLLDGRRCTTTWWRHDELMTRYPRADAAWGAPLIEDGRIVTAGGPLSWIDLSLAAIRRLIGPEAAKIAADFTVVDTIPNSQTVYVPPGHLAASNPFLLEAEHIVREAGDAPMTARSLAQAMGTSERTLHRRLKEASSETPKSFIDRVRFETARMLLETTQQSVKQLAASSGYADETSFRRAFQRYAGMTPGAYRNWAKARATG
ncbi:MAG TPA: helix-turn-helix domain-containing protein [Methylocystis sp.]|nr:helix-turn-helix domain-containing protein [Methylocystis sp.]